MPEGGFGQQRVVPNTVKSLRRPLPTLLSSRKARRMAWSSYTAFLNLSACDVAGGVPFEERYMEPKGLGLVLLSWGS
jgi:hypothetical protein